MSGPRVTFYDLPAEQRLPRVATLAAAAWERGRKLLIHCADDREARALDELLWTFREESFVPHETWRPGTELRDPEARVVLVACEEDPIGADVLVQEAPASAEFARRYAFVIDLVDHRSPQAITASRARFRWWRDEGMRPDYRRA